MFVLWKFSYLILTLKMFLLLCFDLVLLAKRRVP